MDGGDDGGRRGNIHIRSELQANKSSGKFGNPPVSCKYNMDRNNRSVVLRRCGVLSGPTRWMSLKILNTVRTG